uniref:influenza virus NS1A-binding protein homolog n=1 Tax=Erigeron canadensis TaxID=72917 RepID=UPI001CB8F753|nr:influenza virus NS1A-binding protein homolog [Erigeron canadensis]
MVAGNKEANQYSSTIRNLGKSQLGGVIFGATNTTFQECLSKQLFGLPREHLVYVEKIDPGLPLFLLNYSDRKLHGVFEAASHGQKNIDPYAWAGYASQGTRYSAQVQVRLRSSDSPRQPLNEDQFKPIIVDNYYTPQRFWFELDHVQTNQLLALFSSQPISVFKSYKKVENQPKRKDLRTSFSGKTLSLGTPNISIGTIGKDDKEPVYLKHEKLASNSNLVHPPSSRGYEPTCKKVDQPSPVKMDQPPARKDETDAGVKASQDPIIAQLIRKIDNLIAITTEQNHTIGCLEIEITSLEYSLTEAQKEIRNLKDRCSTIESIAGLSVESDPINVKTSSEELHLDNSPETSDINLDCDDLIYLVGGYDGRSWLSSLECYSPSQNQTRSLAPMKTARCHAHVSILNGQLYVLGGGTRGEWYDTVESYDPVVNEWTDRPSLNAKRGSLAGATLNGKIYAIAGGTENEYYATIEMLDLDIGVWIPSRSMLEKRFSLAAAELNGALYAVGGYDGKNYLNTAARFDPREHSWTKIESMNTVRGCPSLVVLNEKLYVLGGFDGRAMVPSVEIYDPRRGSWVIGDSMSYPRGFSAAAVVKESIYILGGLKRGDDINDTVECYKEGQGWETFDTKAGSRRCFFSAVAR